MADVGLVAVALFILGPMTLLATCTMRRLSVSGSLGGGGINQINILQKKHI